MDFKFIVTVLETPLGPSLEWDDDSPIAVERAKISVRYNELKYKVGLSEASRVARAEWLEAYLAGAK